MPELPLLCNGTLVSEGIVEKVWQSFHKETASQEEKLWFVLKRLLIKQEAYRAYSTAPEDWFDTDSRDHQFISQFYEQLRLSHGLSAQSPEFGKILEQWLENRLATALLENLQPKSCCSLSRSPGFFASPELGKDGAEGIKPEAARLQRQIPRVLRDLHQDIHGDSHNMAKLPGGRFLMGTDYAKSYPQDGEGPIREVILHPFYIDCYQVSNRQFRKFTAQTGYVTEAELYGSSFVFRYFLAEEELQRNQQLQAVAGVPWWIHMPGAFWFQPEGPGSGITQRLDHPVVHVSYLDAQMYCRWAQKRLPTEAEWEYAARGGTEQAIFPWGNELEPGGKHMSNVFQGQFPEYNTAADGFSGTAPVGSYPANGYGLYDVIGNVWEWCFDFWQSEHSGNSYHNPVGALSHHLNSHVMKGGSYLCHESWCNRYRLAARTANTAESSGGNLGFRCAADLADT